MNKFARLLALQVWLVFALAMVAGMGAAQGVGSLLPSASDTSETSELADALRDAAENGVSVVVIDTEGRVLSDVSDPSAPDAAAATGANLMTLQDDANAFRSAVVERFLNLPVAFNEVRFILRATSPDGQIFTYVEVLIYSLLVLGIGMVAEAQIFGKRIAKRFVVARIRQAPQGYAEKMPFLVFRFLAGVVGILFSMAVAYALGFILFGPLEDAALQFTASLINAFYFVSRLIWGLWRMILSPYLPQYRIPVIGDRDAKKLHLWLCTVAAVGFFAIFFGIWIRELGLNQEVYVFLFSLLSFAVMLLNIALVWANARAVTGAILNGESAAQSSWMSRFVSLAWAPVAILYFLFAWGDQTYHLVLDDPLGLPLLPAAWAIIMTILVVYGVINYGIERSFDRARALAARNAETEAPAVAAAPR